jgi:YbbR domain-containing protein
MNLPHDIEVDITHLENVGDQVHVRDLKLPSGIELMVSEDEVVALIQQVQEEKVEVAPAADLSAIEVEKKGKEEEGEGEAKAE